jgi:hypothetical protein
MINKSLFTMVALMAVIAGRTQTYITNVTVADVEKQKLVTGQAVIITNDIITKVEPGKALVQARA